jgi:hypothetical protein
MRQESAHHFRPGEEKGQDHQICSRADVRWQMETLRGEPIGDRKHRPINPATDLMVNAQADAQGNKQ